ncbi:hypothetical protein H310_03615 [Aphanomyces invadans]|uniref:Glycosylphosphatidylinositol anchor biosynthesis protein 11 n=1 Tax=Aphanomyces invadans TaxID=157072 RepID=A0A024UHU8_9STRA|nr:hypothetical protein H310_03615 [Aphanomyces invadans]ETW05996.1 hypothetical protein H310_03615 [Aphanomyces invadans]|eukprot:XP_008865773.1 hypothetical protein H310_03615 [Aphanomyces invadans]
MNRAAVGVAQVAVALGSVVYYPRWTGSLESSHPDALARAVFMLGTLTFTVLSISVPTQIHTTKLHALAFSVSATILGAAFFHVVIVFFGAPVFQMCWKTFLLAALVSILAVPQATMQFHSAYNGVTPWIDLLLNARYRDQTDVQMAWTCIGTLLGAYIGTIFIPLDWDRPWQQWPLPCVYGAVYGHVAGIGLSLFATWCGVVPLLVDTKHE